MTIRRFPFKKTKVMLPLNLGKYFTRNGYKDVNVTFSLNEVSCVLEENQSLKDVKSLIKKIGYNIENITVKLLLNIYIGDWYTS